MASYAITIDVGADYEDDFQIFQSDGVTPEDLTGATVTSMIRLLPDDAAPLLTFTCTITDAVNGKFKRTATAAQTAAIPAYAWPWPARQDVSWVTSGGASKSYPVNGSATFIPHATH